MQSTTRSVEYILVAPFFLFRMFFSRIRCVIRKYHESRRVARSALRQPAVALAFERGALDFIHHVARERRLDEAGAVDAAPEHLGDRSRDPLDAPARLPRRAPFAGGLPRFRLARPLPAPVL